MGETGKEGPASSSTEAEFASLTVLFEQADTDQDGLLSYEAFMPMIRVHASTQGYKLTREEAQAIFDASRPLGESVHGAGGHAAISELLRAMVTSPWRVEAARVAHFSELELGAYAAGSFVRRSGAAYTSLLESAFVRNDGDDDDNEPATAWSALAALAQPGPSSPTPTPSAASSSVKALGAAVALPVKATPTKAMPTKAREASSELPAKAVATTAAHGFNRSGSVNRSGSAPPPKVASPKPTVPKVTTPKTPKTPKTSKPIAKEPSARSSQRGSSSTSAKGEASEAAPATAPMASGVKLMAPNTVPKAGASKAVIVAAATSSHQKRKFKRAQTEAIGRRPSHESTSDDEIPPVTSVLELAGAGPANSSTEVAGGVSSSGSANSSRPTPGTTAGGSVLGSAGGVAGGVSSLRDQPPPPPLPPPPPEQRTTKLVTGPPSPYLASDDIEGRAARRTMSFMRNTPALAPALARTTASWALGDAEDGDEGDGDGETDSISPTSRRLRRAHPELSSDELREARSLFSSADRDGNGVLDLTEFTSLMRKLQERPPSTAPRRRAGLASPPLQNTVFTDEEIEMLFRRADVDRSGAIDPEEFITMQLKQRAAHAVAAFARLALGGERTEEEGGVSGGVNGGVNGGAAQSGGALNLGVQITSSAAAASSSSAAALPSSPPRVSPQSMAARSVTFHQAHFETQVGDGSPKRRSPFRRNSTAPSLSQASREHDDETWAVAAADERYRELMRMRAVESALKAPRPDVSDVELDMLEVLFKNADANEDGIVDFDEFIALMDKLSETTGKRYNSLQLRALFRVADLDRSGSIDFNEFIHAQRRVRSSMGAAKTTTMLSTVVGRLGWVWKGRKSQSPPPPDA